MPTKRELKEEALRIFREHFDNVDYVDVHLMFVMIAPHTDEKKRKAGRFLCSAKNPATNGSVNLKPLRYREVNWPTLIGMGVHCAVLFPNERRRTVSGYMIPTQAHELDNMLRGALLKDADDLEQTNPAGAKRLRDRAENIRPGTVYRMNGENKDLDRLLVRGPWTLTGDGRKWIGSYYGKPVVVPGGNTSPKDAESNDPQLVLVRKEAQNEILCLRFMKEDEGGELDQESIAEEIAVANRLEDERKAREAA
ncbi:TPA: hypothetical protein DCZ32_03780, partial [Candidatus Uhrbacteria bacterium]|nr:hypothetical protein [Candidatus Uhrbacteria bacterium]